MRPPGIALPPLAPVAHGSKIGVSDRKLWFVARILVVYDRQENLVASMLMFMASNLSAASTHKTTKAEIRELLDRQYHEDLADRTLRRRLGQLEHEGRLIRKGQSRAIRYHATGSGAGATQRGRANRRPR